MPDGPDDTGRRLFGIHHVHSVHRPVRSDVQSRRGIVGNGPLARIDDIGIRDSGKCHQEHGKGNQQEQSQTTVACHETPVCSVCREVRFVRRLLDSRTPPAQHASYRLNLVHRLAQHRDRETVDYTRELLRFIGIGIRLKEDVQWNDLDSIDDASINTHRPVLRSRELSKDAAFYERAMNCLSLSRSSIYEIDSAAAHWARWR
jgi:hypothetical protein